MEKRILIIEDQHDIQSLIALNLESEGYAISSALDGGVGLQKAMTEPVDLIVLDLMLPVMDGLTVCQKLRQNQINTPILMLTAKKMEADRVVGLEMGADDYLTKPFSIRELQARVKAMLRRVALLQGEPLESIIQHGALTIDRQKRQVQLAGKDVVLTAKEFDLLSYLAAAPGKVFTRDQLLAGVWGYQFSGYEHTVNSHINRLRRKLEHNSAEPDYVITVWGVGYKFRN